jgi:hypothetical protein
MRQPEDHTGPPGPALALRDRVRWRTELVAALSLGAQGVHSLLEFRYVNRVERPHGLPTPTRQFRVTRAGQHQYQDVTYQAYGVVVELDGRVAAEVGGLLSRRGWDGQLRRCGASCLLPP